MKSVTHGTIDYNGKPVERKHIAYLETVNYFYPRITGGEYLGIFKSKNNSFDIAKWNDLFELPLDKLVDKYSTGMKKKLALLGIISLSREIIILDEPFNGLDLETVQKTKMLLNGLKSKKTILITSHILESLTGMCDFISYLNNGAIQFTKAKTEFNLIENEIFAVHQEKISFQIKELLGHM